MDEGDLYEQVSGSSSYSLSEVKYDFEKDQGKGPSTQVAIEEKLIIEGLIDDIPNL